jgi:hypothetical protein
VKRYVMRRDGWLDYFVMKVYSTPSNLRHGVTRDGGEPDPTCEGLVQPNVLLYRDGTLGAFSSTMFATVYLCEPRLRLSPGYLAHECLHIAFAHERFILRYKMEYGPQCSAQEERLAYYHMDIVDGVTKTLRKGGHIR